VGAVGKSCYFQPDWAPGGGLDGAAYCIYDFYVENYDRELEVHYGWNDPPGDMDNAWVAIADFGRQRWSWHPCEQYGMAPARSYSGNFDNDLSMIAFVVIGSDDCALRYVRWGPEQVQAKLSVSPWGGIAPVDVQFNAEYSTTEVGTISDYSWDTDGNGIYETSTGTTPQHSREYSATGMNTARVRVENSYGERGFAESTFVVSQPWAQTWGGGSIEEFTGIAVDAPQAIYCCGKTGSFGAGGADVLVAKFDYFGNLLWARAWGGAAFDSAVRIARDSAGDLVVAGTTDNWGAGETDILIQKWSEDGALIWSTTWGGVGKEFAEDLGSTGTDYYICGHSTSLGSGENDPVLVKFGASGDVTWARFWGGDEDDNAKGLAARTNFATQLKEIHVTGAARSYVYPARSQLYHIEFDGDGSNSALHTWVTSGSSGGKSISVSGLTLGEIYIAGYSGDDIALIEYDDAPGVTAVKWNVPTNDAAACLYRAGDSLYIAGYGFQDIVSTGILLRLSVDGAYESGLSFSSAELGSQILRIFPFPGQGWLVAGDCAAGGGSWSVLPNNTAPASGSWSEAVNITAGVANLFVAHPSAAAVNITAEFAAGEGETGALLTAIAGP